jgi:hypothetical protein
MTIEELMSLSKGDMVASGSEIIKVFKKPKRLGSQYDKISSNH